MSNFHWETVVADYGSKTSVAFVSGGAVIMHREWTPGNETPGDSVALVFIPGATRADFFGEDTNAPR